MTPTNVEAIKLPDIPRKYKKVQPKGERLFSASGPKADIVMRHLLAGGFTAQEIADAAQCSLSRVREVMWCLDAANVEYPKLQRAPRKTGNPDVAAVPVEVIEAKIIEAKTSRTRKPAAKKSAPVGKVMRDLAAVLPAADVVPIKSARARKVTAKS